MMAQTSIWKYLAKKTLRLKPSAAESAYNSTQLDSTKLNSTRLDTTWLCGFDMPSFYWFAIFRVSATILIMTFSDFHFMFNVYAQRTATSFYYPSYFETITSNIYEIFQSILLLFLYLSDTRLWRNFITFEWNWFCYIY